MRAFAGQVYGIPPEQVIGSAGKLKYEVRDGKPVGIQLGIGRRPVLAFGNSDGDFQMLEWTTSGAGARLGLLIHHDDGEREWAHDRESSIGRLERGLDEGPKRNWVIVSMKNDWSLIFPNQPERSASR